MNEDITKNKSAKYIVTGLFGLAILGIVIMSLGLSLVMI